MESKTDKIEQNGSDRLERSVIRILHDRFDPDIPNMKVELFEVIGEMHPFRIRMIDVSTGEIGPNIPKFERLGSAAAYYEENTPIW